MEKAFLQFKIDPSQRTFLHFFWPLGISENPDAPIRGIWGTVLDFGLICSPWLHCQGLRFYLESEISKNPSDSQFIREIIDHFYMDDIVAGATSLKQAKARVDTLFKVFSAGHFPLKKWATNNAELGKYIDDHTPLPSTRVVYSDNQFKILGIRWKQNSDELGVFVRNEISELITHKPTKRHLLKGLAQIFDPLGILSPITVKAKMLRQKLWVKKVDWDVELSGELYDSFLDFTKELQSSGSLSIDRSFGRSQRAARKRELHCLCDASLSAFGCVVLYICGRPQ